MSEQDDYRPTDGVVKPDCKDHKHSQSDGRTHQCPKCGRYTFPGGE